jgi:deoxyribodipyrimidine photolyase-related protein
MSRTIWIQANQLGRDNSALAELLRPEGFPPPSQVLMIEASDRRVHKRKLVLLLSAMRHFAGEFQKRRITVDYYPLLPDGSHSHRTVEDALRIHLQKFAPAEMSMMELPDVRGRQAAASLLRGLGIPLRTTRNTNVLVDRDAFAADYRSRKHLTADQHYRSMRAQHRLLMDGDRPAGGRWQPHAVTGKPPEHGSIPRPVSFLPDSITCDVIKTVNALFPDHPGTTAGFDLPVTHAQAIALIDDYIAHRLPLSGTCRERMMTGDPLLYNSFAAPFLSIGLLSPLHLLKKIEHAYRTGAAPLDAVERFMRQVLGQREYLYGIYQTLMPAYLASNHLNARRLLPAFFWNGATDLHCLAETIGIALRTGYLNQSQRLMVIGNFATLTGIRPLELLDWFMSLFLDAHEWVTAPNVISMGTFADGGRVADRPTVSGGGPINRISDYCRLCRYSARATTGPHACPLNYLYWNFLDRNRQLSGNPRLALQYRKLSTMSTAERRAIHHTAEKFLLCLPR